MSPFIRRTLPSPDDALIARLRKIAAERGVDFDREVAPRLFSHPGELFVNDRYSVIREQIGAYWHLSIRPHAKSQSRSWKDYQQIKNELVGKSNEGVELFPAEGRLTDLADQYHLWVAVDPSFRFPFGFDERSVY